MPRYEIKGKGKDTGRNRKRTYSAANELEARQQAENDGTVVEEVTEIPPELPQRHQSQRKDVDMLPLEQARWKLAIIWFPVCGLLFILLIAQSIGGAYGDNIQRVWGWALPNFLPTLALMVSVFAADALNPYHDEVTYVRKNFCKLSLGLSVFYLVVLMASIFVQPFLKYFRSNPNIDSITARIELLEMSNFWLGPLQGLVVVSLGVLFFLKESGKLD